MCGIFGFVGSGGLPLAQRAKLMATALNHRGPDDEGFHADERAMLGNRRLSIIDLEHGHQPIFSDDRQIVVVQNGEIYNYIELQDELKAQGVRFDTHSDTEVILRMYEAYGPSFVERLNGMFAIAIWDARSGSMHLFRDRIGQKPLFFARTQHGIAFASEIKALLAIGVPATPRMEAVHHFLSFNYVPPTMTMLEDVHHVQPGWQVTIDGEKITDHRWWKPNLATRSQWSFADAKHELRETLRDAVRIHLRSDVEVGAFLSGGVDSSVVVALSSEFVKPPMHSFTIGFENPDYDESRYGEQVSRQFHTAHHTEIVHPDMIDLWPKALYYCDQPHGDASFLPTYVLSALAARHVKVVVTGDGSDELLGGYQRYLPFLAQYGSADDATFERAYFANQGLVSHEQKLALYRPEWQARLAGVDSFQQMLPDFEETRGLDPINRMLWMDVKWLLPGNNLVKPDRMGMAEGLEARVPFLDNRVIDLALAMPGNFKVHGDSPKHILKESMEGLLPRDILHRPKQMFTVPIGEWFKSHLSNYLTSLLLSERACSRGLFDPSAIKQLAEDHIAERANHTRLLRALVAVEIWFRLFVDGESHQTVREYGSVATLPLAARA